MLDWIASAMKNYKGSDMDITTPRPTLNSPVREGTADAELFVQATDECLKTYVEFAHQGRRRRRCILCPCCAPGRCMARFPIVLDKILAEMRERPGFSQEMMRQEIPCNCSTCRDVH